MLRYNTLFVMLFVLLLTLYVGTIHIVEAHTELENEKSAKLAEIAAKEAEKAIAEQNYREAEAKYLQLKAEQEGDG